METPEPGIDALVQAAVRRELNKIARRYVPIVGGAIAFALIVALVPTVDERNASNDRGLRASAGSQPPNSGSAASDSAAAPGVAGAAGDTTATVAQGAATDTAGGSAGASNSGAPGPTTPAGI